MKKENYIVSKKLVIRAKRNLVLMIKNVTKSEIVITQENIKELLFKIHLRYIHI